MNKIFFSLLFFCLFAQSASADTATASQKIKIIIPKVTLIDVDNTSTPLQITLNPMQDAGDNFGVVRATSTYDVTSNVKGLKLYANTDQDLINQYNLSLKVNESGSTYRELTTTPQQVSHQGQQAQQNQMLRFEVGPAFTNKTIPYGNINTTITYTLVEQ